MCFSSANMSALNLKHRHPFIDGLDKHPEGKKKDMVKIKNWWVCTQLLCFLEWENYVQSFDTNNVIISLMAFFLIIISKASFVNLVDNAAFIHQTSSEEKPEFVSLKIEFAFLTQN